MGSLKFALKFAVTPVIMITCNQGPLYPTMCGLGYKAGLPGLLKGMLALRSAQWTNVGTTITNPLAPLFFLQNIIPNPKQGFWSFDT